MDGPSKQRVMVLPLTPIKLIKLVNFSSADVNTRSKPSSTGAKSTEFFITCRRKGFFLLVAGSSRCCAPPGTNDAARILISSSSATAASSLPLQPL
uniref:Uncharacterized protein n=1 Tax=Leersia perrieri TaxID=77586 RepID=A0A0D9XUL1_9ORYZ